jgi:hypothetical protein
VRLLRGATTVLATGASLVALALPAAADTGTALPDVSAQRALVEQMTALPVTDQARLFATLDSAEQTAYVAASRPTSRRLETRNAAGEVTWASDPLPIDPVATASEAPVHTELVPELPAGASLSGNSTSVEFYECLYGLFEQKLACFFVPVEWAWSGALVTAQSHYQTGGTYTFLWKYDGKLVSLTSPSIGSPGAVHIVEGGQFCAHVGIGSFSGCLYSWDPTFDITVAANGAYFAYDVTGQARY